ncbi:transmembrane protein, putative (macronuclear) [Tetrahymena thermophila SB210]|uniref:Transmembrane protein, putative n=1 Tax=Tetrahymena thermophila (strain SB210) TaxID=312017 RepID=Q23Q65_TETTS|nr:transmembrane protein, putative [Tetrahymena thermophila SB210]EAR98719.3 transmembrane protein, putative [Tetrahymena thermophila SB210]|eukprot:XP_001018964.3 transmembrane protein, putative [Tetrahymena thermophila SB210]
MIQEQNQNIDPELDEIQFDDYVKKAQNTHTQNNQLKTHVKNLEDALKNMNQQQATEQQAAQSSPKVAKTLCLGLCYLIIKIVFATGSSITFGVLFYIFQKYDEHNDYCENETLKKWALSISILFFINSGLFFLEFLEEIFLKQEYNEKGPLGILLYPLKSLVGIGFFTCLIGLQINNSSECGSLYKVTLAYCIITYIGFGILGLALIFMCLAFIIRKISG